MYFGSSPTGAIDSYARQKLAEQDRTIRQLAKQVAELTAALKARDEADATALDLVGERT
jgi:ABC-type transporter Mla subunit MlaD